MLDQGYRPPLSSPFPDLPQRPGESDGEYMQRINSLPPFFCGSIAFMSKDYVRSADGFFSSVTWSHPISRFMSPLLPGSLCFLPATEEEAPFFLTADKFPLYAKLISCFHHVYLESLYIFAGGKQYRLHLPGLDTCFFAGRRAALAGSGSGSGGYGIGLI